MSFFSVFDIASSALNALSVRLNVTSSNLANAESVSSSVGQTYRARHPVFSTLVQDSLNRDPAVAGVRVVGIVESQAPLKVEHRPDHPMADENGNIYLPNVNLVEEMADMISASRSYQSNVEVVNATKQMAIRTLSLGQ
ncbi:MAG: flagellar basal body rod protein FlgC [Gammaproteobacteria bacterium]|nr:flagellar basal body rod protein FlgC [Gammaproteobacteria bacterium]MDJ0891894.1 flagellar basal body rod protein FlgC [Gammaproteobacteria bacterium]